MEEPMIDVRQMHTRFLWPFLTDADYVAEIEHALEPEWTRQLLPHLYRDELLTQAQEFLSGDLVYLKHSHPETLFPEGLTAVLSKGVTVPVKIPRGGGVELFLSQEGVAVLSMTLAVAAPHPTTAALDFNYRLGRRIGAKPAKLHVAPRSQDDPPVPPDAPPSERIGKPGGAYTLAEVIERLIAPLQGFHPRQMQSRLSVYTVASFPSNVAFDRESCVAWAGPFLSALAQVEEPLHAGAKANSVDVPNSLMNRCHWAAVGVLGAAHIVADQPPPEGAADHPFNPERIYRIRDKYFVPFLIGLIQRHVLNAMAAKAVTLVHGDKKEQLRELRMRFLRFGVGGRFSQVSSRHALHRYYRLVQQGLDVREAWSEVRDALSDIDASNIAMDVATNVNSMVRLQHAAHALEYVIISVYAAHLWHMFADGNQDLFETASAMTAPWMPHGWRLSPHWLVAWGVIVAAGLGWLAVYLWSRFEKRRAASHDLGKKRRLPHVGAGADGSAEPKAVAGANEQLF